MRCNRLRFEKPSKAQLKAMRNECGRVFNEQLETYNRMVALQIMYILRFKHGFGKTRLMQFFTDLKAMQANHIDRYEVTNDEVPDICEIKLRESGINIEDFFE